MSQRFQCEGAQSGQAGWYPQMSTHLADRRSRRCALADVLATSAPGPCRLCCALPTQGFQGCAWLMAWHEITRLVSEVFVRITVQLADCLSVISGGTQAVFAAAGEHSAHTVRATRTVAPGVHGMEIDYFQVSLNLDIMLSYCSCVSAAATACGLVEPCQLEALDECGPSAVPAPRVVVLLLY